MNRPKALRATCLVLGLAVLLASGGCGHRGEPQPPPLPDPPRAQPSGPLPGNFETNFTPEEPWWFAATPTIPAVPTRVTLSSDVLFETGSAVLSLAAESQLGGVLRLAADGHGSVEVIGHTDSDGTEEYNLALSERRAGAVADWLASRGVDRSRLVVSGRGESEPVAPNDSATHKAANRRVTVSVG